jgi:hypothetical protein
MTISEQQGQEVLDKIINVSNSPAEVLELCASIAATFIYHHISAIHTEDFLTTYTQSIRDCIVECRRQHGTEDGTESEEAP